MSGDFLFYLHIVPVSLISSDVAAGVGGGFDD